MAGYDESCLMVHLCTVTPEQQQIAEAIKSLRTELKESQQQFSNRLGVVVRTVARWELEKPPSGKTLLELGHVAEEAGRTDLRTMFYRTYSSALIETFTDLYKAFWPTLHAEANAALWLMIVGDRNFRLRWRRFLRAEMKRAISTCKTEDRDVLLQFVEDLK